MAEVKCVNEACAEFGKVKDLAVTLAPGEIVRCGGMTPDGPCATPLDVDEGQAQPA